MKKIAFFSLMILSFVYASGQDNTDDEVRTLFGQKGWAKGAYGGFYGQYSQIDGRDAGTFGVRAAFIMNHSLAIGFGGAGFFSDFRYDNSLNSDMNYAGGYGGLLIEPILLPRTPIHLSVPILIGGGGVSYAYADNWDDDSDTKHSAVNDAFFIVEPGVELEFNLVKFMRIGVGVYYRYTSDVTLNDAFKKDGLQGITSGITFKFGKF